MLYKHTTNKLILKKSTTGLGFDRRDAADSSFPGFIRVHALQSEMSVSLFSFLNKSPQRF